MLDLRLRWIAVSTGLGAFGVACGSSNGTSPSGDGGPDSTVLDGGTDSPGQNVDGSSRPDGASQDGTLADRAPGSDATSQDSSVDAATTDAGPVSASVLQYHMNASRDGHYVDPLMTPSAAAGLKIDTTFAGTLTLPPGGVAGTVWSQPLYVESGYMSKGTFYVADDADNVFALDETTGGIDWAKAIDTPSTLYGNNGTSAAGAAGHCGNDPGNGLGGTTGALAYIGITGTPVIDLPSRTMFLVAVHATAGTDMPIETYKIHAISIDTGDEVTTPPGWPIDMSTITSAEGVLFNPQPQIERGALALVNGYLYVPFGGEDGDCGDYHGWVVSVPIANPSGITGFTTTTSKGGIWAVGGLSSDGTDVFAATGNGNAGTTWQGSEAILRFTNGSTFSGATADYFTPSDWAWLDNGDPGGPGDLDLGGTGPVVIDVAGTTPSNVVVAYGKSGVVHVLNRADLGGVAAGATGQLVTAGQGVYSAQPTTTQIRNGPVAYTSGGTTYTAFQASCTGGDLLALKFATSGVPSYSQAWCANTGSQGSPMVTTTDSTGSNPIVWMTGANSSYGAANVTAWNGTTGTQIFGMTTMIALQKVSKWTTPIDVKGRIFVAAGTQLYALTTQ
jgi:hypothetical protein